MEECGFGNFGLGKQLNVFKWSTLISLVDHPSRNMKDSGAESNVYYHIPAQDVSREKKWPGGNSCNILAKKKKKIRGCIFKST